MKLKALVASIGVFALSAANAGEPAAKEVCVTEEPIGATISTGYMTNYIFYGVEFAEHGVWTGIDYTIDALPIPVDVGLWYINGIEAPGGYDELDLYASVAGPSIAGFDTSVTFTAYLFPELGNGHTYEVALGASRSLGIIDFAGSARYDFEIEGWYFDVDFSKAFDITDNVALVASAGVGYTIDYFSQGSAFNHAYAQLSLPIALRSNVTLEPYVAGLFALDAVDDFQDDVVHGGVSLSIDF